MVWNRSEPFGTVSKQLELMLGRNRLKPLEIVYKQRLYVFIFIIWFDFICKTRYA